MDPERRLREHLGAAAAGLPDPGDHLDTVKRRGRRRRLGQTAVAVAAVTAVAVALPTAVSRVGRTAVDFAPAGPAPAASEGPSELMSTPPGVPAETDPPATEEPVAAEDLGASVLRYGPQDLKVVGDEEMLVYSGAVDMALADGRNGVVLQVGKRLLWFPESDPRRSVQLLKADGPMALRMILPDDRVLYSVRDREISDNMKERFYAVALAEGAEPEHLAEVFAYESWTSGPAATADDTFVHGACHLLCTLYAGLAEEPQGAEPLYYGGGGDIGPETAIDGLTATPDGTVLAFVETTPTYHEGLPPPTLVVLDGTTLEPLARVELPLTPQARRRMEEGSGLPIPQVSLSADARRVLVSMDRILLVENALRPTPEIRIVDDRGQGAVMRWLDPAAAIAG